MPIDMPLCLSKEDFLLAPRQPALRFDSPAPNDASKATKHVTFADERGLALTRVKVFSPLDDLIAIPPAVRETLRPAAAAAGGEEQLELDFAQPSSDYLLFRRRLEANLVSLERCVLKERAFAGTVKVKNVSFEKRVALRVSFDAWRSHRDVDCVYVRDAYGGSGGGDTFSFEVPLPADLPPHRRVEFAVRYAVDGREHWDSNHGNNYSIVWSSARRGRGWRPEPDDSLGIHWDRYGSPTCSHGLLPDWPGYQHTGPYY